MVNPYNERLEAIERDLFENKRAISVLTKQIKTTNTQLVEAFRNIASLNVNLFTFWFDSLLSAESKRSDFAKKNARLCIRHARERAGKALTEIKYSNKPMSVFISWRKDCDDYFSKRGFDLLG